MGWFRRSDDSGDGLYRGDAPVSMPGTGDQEPSAYVSRPQAPHPDPASPAPEWPSGPPTGPRTPGQVSWGQVPPGQAPPGQVPSGQWTAPGQWAPPDPVAPGGWAPPPGSAASAAPVTVAQRARPGAGCGLLAIVVILVVLIGVGVAGWAVFRSVRSALPSARDVPATAVGTIDVPITVVDDDGQLRITISGAQAQPGGGWDDENGEPTLIVSTTIERVDDGSSPCMCRSSTGRSPPTTAARPPTSTSSADSNPT